MTKHITAAKHSGYKGNPTNTPKQRKEERKRERQRRAERQCPQGDSRLWHAFFYHLPEALTMGLRLLAVSLAARAFMRLLRAYPGQKSEETM